MLAPLQLPRKLTRSPPAVCRGKKNSNSPVERTILLNEKDIWICPSCPVDVLSCWERHSSWSSQSLPRSVDCSRDCRNSSCEGGRKTAVRFQTITWWTSQGLVHPDALTCIHRTPLALGGKSLGALPGDSVSSWTHTSVECGSTTWNSDHCRNGTRVGGGERPGAVRGGVLDSRASFFFSC